MFTHQTNLLTDRAVLGVLDHALPGRVYLRRPAVAQHGGAVCNTLVACTGWGGAYNGRINELPQQSPERGIALISFLAMIGGYSTRAVCRPVRLHTPKYTRQRVRK